ncbi:type II toxin-antitoxin system HipA family toxin [Vreelandella utahensis]|uniref:type II toxin-antitoxin system HipA family toxin n=1 Tax=Vreelandella halophila TaxID=86177 RepID=UPI000986F0E6|nr:type II toxin-antitoxin system HipA family toxin [Halomonas utahensis]
MTSETPQATTAFVWFWLPGQTEPVVAGRLDQEGEQLVFTYARSYLERSDAVALFPAELPLKRGPQPPLPGLMMPGCIRDAAPDAWGRRIIINRLSREPNELGYLLASGSDRIGALDFQSSATEYIPRGPHNAPIEELAASAERVEQGLPLNSELDRALFHGTSIGGARPKALIEDGDRKFVAKFSSSTDLYSLVKAEFIAMRLASHAGLNVAPVSLTQAAGKDVLLVERFDRTPSGNGGWQRHAVISALTLLELDELMARYASYEDLAERIRLRFRYPEQMLRELFARLVFNILTGNTDDHARNHAAFWNGKTFELTPAYDICPQSRTGNEASQAMLIRDSERASQLGLCLEVAHQYLLSRDEAMSIMERQIRLIGEQWDYTCDQAALSPAERSQFMGRQFLNPFIFENLPEDANHLEAIADDIRQR